MDHDHLADFLDVLENAGELVRVSAQVDPAFEIAEITDRICKSSEDGPALLFDNVKNHTIPVVTNLLGSRSRMCRALHADSLEEVADRIAGLVQPDLPESWLESLKLVPQFASLTKLPPKTVASGLCQQVVKMGRDVDLGQLPLLQNWPEEAGPTITAGQVYTTHPETGVRNVGLYPLQLCGPDRLSIHWHAHHDGYQHWREYKQREQQMPVAVVLGGDPVFFYIASAPLPANTDECLLGGFLRSKNIDLVRCRSLEMEVPADAEIVIEGRIDTSAPNVSAGTIALPTGFYSLPEETAQIHVTAVTHRSNPLFPALIGGRPPMEDYWLGKATERILLPLIRLFIPEVVDMNLPRVGASRNFLFVSIHKEYPQHAHKVMHAMWSLKRLMVSKFIVVVDADVDVHNEEQVWFHVGANAHPGRDVLFSPGPGDLHDHATPVRGLGHKMGIDATRKLSDEGHPRPWPEPVQMRPDIREQVTRRWGEFGFETET